jgi:phage terminase Nu1 subunit (DNA packaging protein)
MKDQLTTDELSALLGCSAEAVRILARKNVISKVHGRFPTAESVRRAFAYSREAAAGRSGSAAAGVAKARQRVLQLQGDKLAAEAEREAGKWIETESVREALETICRGLRVLMMAVPTRVAGRSPLSREDIALVDAEVRDALTEAAHMSLPQLREIAMTAKELAPP